MHSDHRCFLHERLLLALLVGPQGRLPKDANFQVGGLRIGVFDLGMDHEAAETMGRTLERMSDAGPMEPLGSTAAQLGPAAQRVAGLAFTHLHTDHTSGLAALCESLQTPARLVRAPLQAEQTNYTTRAGRDQTEEAPCVDTETLEGGPLYEVPGFPGLTVVPVAGHTPGSQVFIAHVRAGEAVESWVFTGDVANHVDGILLNLPKPRLYSILVVPEATGRLERVRLWLRELAQDHAAHLLVSHDQRQLEQSGLARWAAGN